MSPQMLISVMLTVNLQKDEVESLKRLKTLQVCAFQGDFCIDRTCTYQQI